jgi:hypothetical protein
VVTKINEFFNDAVSAGVQNPHGFFFAARHMNVHSGND